VLLVDDLAAHAQELVALQRIAQPGGDGRRGGAAEVEADDLRAEGGA